MANWDELIAFVRMRYEIMRQGDGELWFNLPTTNGRSQIVAVRQVVGEDGHPWAQITSAIGRVEQIDLVKLLELAAEPVTGGVVAEGGLALFRDAIPLDYTQLDGFEHPFRLVVAVADRLERELTGADEG